MLPDAAMYDADFVVLNEDYSRYLLRDGTLLRLKIVVRRIFFNPNKTPEGYPAAFGLDTANIIAAIVPLSLKRSPSGAPFDPMRDKGEELKFDEQDVKTQEYMTSDGFKVTVKPVLTKVLKYSKYNELGEPIYNAVIQSITNVERITSTADRA